MTLATAPAPTDTIVIPGRRTLTPLGRRIRANGVLVAAFSTDMQWDYERADTIGTPWEVTHRPTGHLEVFGNLIAAREWTASDRAVPLMRAVAVYGLRTATGPDRIRLLRAVAVYDGELVPGGIFAEAGARCGCGGILTEVGIEWRHLDVCDECRLDPSVCTLEDRYRTHLVCDRPAAVQCGHGACRAESQGVELCDHGLISCKSHPDC